MSEVGADTSSFTEASLFRRIFLPKVDTCRRRSKSCGSAFPFVREYYDVSISDSSDSNPVDLSVRSGVESHIGDESIRGEMTQSVVEWMMSNDPGPVVMSSEDTSFYI